MRSRIISLAVTFGVFLCVTGVASAAEIFTRDLQQGDSGSDVLALQQLLNATIARPIAATGPGSKGNEVEYFGAKTKAALVAFQEQYRAEILAPTGLRYGTGSAGPRTRAVLNRLWEQMKMKNTPAVATTTVTRVQLRSISPTRGTFGTVVTLSGIGFSRSNTIYTGHAVLRNVPSLDGTTLTFTYPLTIPGISFTAEQVAGVDATLPFWIYVENETGATDALLFNFSPIH